MMIAQAQYPGYPSILPMPPLTPAVGVVPDSPSGFGPGMLPELPFQRQLAPWWPLIVVGGTSFVLGLLLGRR